MPSLVLTFKEEWTERGFGQDDLDRGHIEMRMTETFSLCYVEVGGWELRIFEF